MNRKTTHRQLLTAALCFALPLGGIGCNSALSDEDLALGEAAAFLTASEESGAIGGDAVAAAAPDTLASMGAEDAGTATEPPVDDGSACDFAARRQAVLEKFDTNGNGELDREELRALKADLGGTRPRLAQLGRRARHQAFWRVRWAFDEDGDRTLSSEERSALVDALQARCERRRAERLERYDTNQDGTLDEAERQEAREAVRARWEAKRQELLAKYDTNGNGTLEDAERAVLREDRIAAARERRAALLARYDTNGDGQLSTEEALPLRQEIQRRIIEGHDAE